jgi:hypothetical protein
MNKRTHLSITEPSLTEMQSKLRVKLWENDKGRGRRGAEESGALQEKDGQDLREDKGVGFTTGLNRSEQKRAAR